MMLLADRPFHSLSQGRAVGPVPGEASEAGSGPPHPSQKLSAERNRPEIKAAALEGCSRRLCVSVYGPMTSRDVNWTCCGDHRAQFMQISNH